MRFFHSIAVARLLELLDCIAEATGGKVVLFAVAAARYQMGALLPSCAALIAVVVLRLVASCAKLAAGRVLAALPVVAESIALCALVVRARRNEGGGAFANAIDPNTFGCDFLAVL